MGLFSKFKRPDTQVTDQTISSVADGKHSDNASSQPTDTDSDHLSLEERNEKEIERNPNQVTEDAFDGVKKAEAVALVWPKWAVWSTYAWIWVCFFMLALQQGTTTQFNATAYASFSAAPQLTTAGILASIIGGVLKLPIAKILNLWGRAEGFVLFIIVYEVGMIILASCNGPSSYAAGYVLYWIGYDAIYVILDIFVADTSGLRNRAFAFAFVSTPFICTAFTAPLLAQAFLRHSTWRWGYGAFCIIMAAIFLPLAGVFKYYQLKAQKMGVLKTSTSGRNALQSFVHYFHEFDIIGCILLMAAFVLFLLPFSLESYGKAQYSSAKFIAMLVIGILLFPTFALWEKFGARVHFVRWELLKQRTVLGACCLSAIVYFSFYCWDTYYYSFAMVVYNLTYSEAGYMSEIYNVGSCFWGVIFGIWVRYTKHFKYTCLCFGIPLMILGSGLMIHFRGENHGIGYLVMCQIFIAFAGGTLVNGEDMAVMAAADRDGVPMMLSLVSLCSNLGGAIGTAVIAAIYDNTFLSTLEKSLPASELANAETIYIGGYTTQMTYAVGSPTRIAINHAWGETQKYGSIASTCILVLGFPAIAVWKNYNVNRKQNKGTVI